MRARILFVALLVVAFIASARTARADEQSRIAAEALFNEGRGLLGQGDLAKACEKFDASHRLDPSVGAALNLAECASRRGETATAWLHYRDAAAIAAQHGDRERERTALQRADSLVVPRLKVRAAQPTPQGLTVQRDGAAVDPAAFGVALPLNPGVHVIEASAPGYAPWRTRIDVPATGTTVEVVVPALRPEAPPREATSTTTADTRPSSGSSQRTIALALGGVSVLAAATGTIFGLRAASSWSDVTDACPDRRCPDDRTADSVAGARNDAVRDATIATSTFVVSGVALVGCVVLWLTSPGRDAAAHAGR